MRAIAFGAIFTIHMLGAEIANAQTVATNINLPVPVSCQFSKPAREVNSLRALPAVAAEFRRQKLDVADVGEKFIPFDVDNLSKGLPHRQFVRAYVFADRTVVWYYRGGLVANFHVVELKERRDVTSKDAPLLLRLTGRALIGLPCAATEAILAGVDGQQGW